MSNQLDNKLSEAKQTAHKMLEKGSLKKQSAVEIAKTRSTKDMVLWILALVALICATLTNYKLSGLWQPANNVWVRVGIIAALIIFAIVCLASTNQGRSFKVLLKDASIELRRVTWPTKTETIQYTWQSLLVIGIVAAIVWLLDNFFTWLVGLLLG